MHPHKVAPKGVQDIAETNGLTVIYFGKPDTLGGSIPFESTIRKRRTNSGYGFRLKEVNENSRD